MSDIRLAELDPAAGLELGIAGSRGGVLLNEANDIVHSVSFSERAGRVQIVDIEGDGTCEFMNRGGGWQPVGLFDHAGQSLWQYDPEGGANDMAAGDLDGDGVLDFVVGCNGAGGVHRLDRDGRRRWKEKDVNVWSLEILDADGDGQPEIIHTNAHPSEVRWRDRRGAIIQHTTAPSGLANFSIINPQSDSEPIEMVFFSKQRKQVRLATLDGTLTRDLHAPVPDSLSVYGAWATPVVLEPSGPTLTAVVLWLRRPYKSSFGGFYLYDETGKLLYGELVDQQLSTVAVIPNSNNSAQRLLVGGDGVVWEYKWVEDTSKVLGTLTHRGLAVAGIPVALSTECDILTKVRQKTSDLYPITSIQLVITDDQGQFEFTLVHPGTYRLLINTLPPTGTWKDNGYAPRCTPPISKQPDSALVVDWTLIKSDLTIRFPPANGKVETLRPVIEWDAYPEATFYKVALVQTTPNRKEVFLDNNMTSNRFEPPEPLKAGSAYLLIVRGHAAADDPLVEKRINFTVPEGTTD